MVATKFETIIVIYPLAHTPTESMTEYICLNLEAPLLKPLWPQNLPQRLWDKQNGKCYHCLHDLPPRDEVPRRYDIDCYPIPFEDISDNICSKGCIRVADVFDETNLIATHFLCSKSNLYQQKGRKLFCGRTQCFCPARKTWCLVWLFAFMCLGFGIGILIGINQFSCTI